MQAELAKRDDPNKIALIEHLTHIHTAIDDTFPRIAEQQALQLGKNTEAIEGLKQVVELLADDMSQTKAAATEAKAASAENSKAIALLMERVVGTIVGTIEKLAKREKRASDSLVDIAVESTRDARAYRSKRLALRYKLALAILPIAAAALGRVSATAQCAHSPIPAGAQQSVSK